MKPRVVKLVNEVDIRDDVIEMAREMSELSSGELRDFIMKLYSTLHYRVYDVRVVNSEYNSPDIESIEIEFYNFSITPPIYVITFRGSKQPSLVEIASFPCRYTLFKRDNRVHVYGVE